MQLGLEDLQEAMQREPLIKNGCIVDTNLLFAAFFPLDAFNEWAESVFGRLHELDIPIFTNLNVRSEFIELNRRVLLPEGLVELYTTLTGTLHPELEQQLKSLKTLKDKSAKENQTFKFNEVQIKKYKKLLSRFSFVDGQNAWDTFCEEYFLPYIKGVWDEAVTTLKLNFLGTQEIESGEYFSKRPSWQDMIEIVGRTGIGTADAMIVNLFDSSTLSLVLTADNDVTSAVSRVTRNRYIVSP